MASNPLPLSTIIDKPTAVHVKPVTVNPMGIQIWPRSDTKPEPKPDTKPAIYKDDNGEHYIIKENEKYYLDGEDGRILAKGWRRVSEGDEVWYIHTEQESSWLPTYAND